MSDLARFHSSFALPQPDASVSAFAPPASLENDIVMRPPPASVDDDSHLSELPLAPPPSVDAGDTRAADAARDGAHYAMVGLQHPFGALAAPTAAVPSVRSAASLGPGPSAHVAPLAPPPLPPALAPAQPPLELEAAPSVLASRPNGPPVDLFEMTPRTLMAMLPPEWQPSPPPMMSLAPSSQSQTQSSSSDSASAVMTRTNAPEGREAKRQHVIDMTMTGQWRTIFEELATTPLGTAMVNKTVQFTLVSLSHYRKALRNRWERVNCESRRAQFERVPQTHCLRTTLDAFLVSAIGLAELSSLDDRPLYRLLLAALFEGGFESVLQVAELISRHPRFEAVRQRNLSFLQNQMLLLPYLEPLLDSRKEGSRPRRDGSGRFDDRTVSDSSCLGERVDVTRDMSSSSRTASSLRSSPDVTFSFAAPRGRLERASRPLQSASTEHTSSSERSRNEYALSSTQHTELNWEPFFLAFRQLDLKKTASRLYWTGKRQGFARIKPALVAAWTMQSATERCALFARAPAADFLRITLDEFLVNDRSWPQAVARRHDPFYRMALALLAAYGTERVVQFAERVHAEPDLVSLHRRFRALKINEKRSPLDPELPSAEASDGGARQVASVETGARAHDTPSVCRLFAEHTKIGEAAHRFFQADNFTGSHSLATGARELWIRLGEQHKRDAFSLFRDGALARLVIDAVLLSPADEHQFLRTPHDSFARLLVAHLDQGGLQKVGEFLHVASSLGFVSQWKRDAKRVVTQWLTTLSERQATVARQMRDSLLTDA